MMTIISNMKFSNKYSILYSIPNTKYIFSNDLTNIISIVNNNHIDLVLLLNVNPNHIIQNLICSVTIIHNCPNLTPLHDKNKLIYLNYNNISLEKLLLQINTALLRQNSKSHLYRKIGIIGKSNIIQTLRNNIATVAKYNSPVLIIGQTGTGKNLIAQSIHNYSRLNGKFVPINCANLSDSLFESELFGHTKGSFTNAYDKVGYLKLADSGTLFFDEFSELSISNQPRILRVIENQSFYRLGDVKETKTNVRLLFASNQSEDFFHNNKKFRKDLFYRISTTIIRVPPLVEHIEDISDLINYHISKNTYQFSFSESNIQYLKEYSWPGNVRELFSFIDRINIFYSKIPFINFTREKLYNILLQKD